MTGPRSIGQYGVVAKKKKSGKSSKAEQKLESAVKKLRRRLDAAESDAKQWRRKAKKHKAKAADAKAESTRLRNRSEEPKIRR